MYPFSRSTRGCASASPNIDNQYWGKHAEYDGGIHCHYHSIKFIKIMSHTYFISHACLSRTISTKMLKTLTVDFIIAIIPYLKIVGL